MRLFISLLTIAFALLPASLRSGETIDHQRLNGDVAVVGSLGVPLGTIIEIEASIVDGSSLRVKSADGRYLLQITKVGTTPLRKPILCDFALCPGSPAKLANDNFALYELKTGSEAHSLTDTQIVELKRDYVGRKYSLQVYETGTFRGIPKGLPSTLVWQDTEFGFYTDIIVLETIESKK